MNLHVLIASPDPVNTVSLQTALEGKGLRVSRCSTGREAVELVLGGTVDGLITEVVFEDLGGKDLVHHLLASMPGFPILVRTIYPNIEDAFELAHLGVRGYLPVSDGDEVVVQRMLEEMEHSSPIAVAQDESATASGPWTAVVARNRETAALFRTAIDRVAHTSSTVLIRGESGTGKELLARTIHLHSKRAEKPWVAVNCSALPESLVETELFGHEKGAFTGATAQRKGRFELADGGTFFLDEVGDLTSTVQAKLLRVLQEKSIERVGSSETIPVDVRLIAATHRDLKKMVERGTFREDLFYRLSVIPLHLPPLRQRPEDIPELVRAFVERFRRETGRSTMALTPHALQALSRHTWPGNVRELENAIEHAVVMAHGNRIELLDLPETIRQASPELKSVGDLRLARAEFEREFILRALTVHLGNVSATADAIGLARKNLQQKINQYQIDVDTIREAVQEQPSPDAS